MTYALMTLTPGLGRSIAPITVNCKRGLKDLHTLPPEAHEQFARAVAQEFPRGEKICGLVMDVTVNHKNWKKNPYLYACILGTNGKLQCQHDTSFHMSMELLLYTCVNMVTENAQLLDKCRSVFDNPLCTCSLAWKLHKLDIDSDGSVVRKMEGVGGTIDYHIVASVSHDIGDVHHDLGYVYHTTHWRENTYHPTGPLPSCTRALVVPGHDALPQALRTAVAAAWLALS